MTMKRAAVLALGAVAALAVGMSGVEPVAAAANGLGLFRDLAGTWEGASGDGKAVRVTYEVVSGGTAVLERFSMEDHPEMVTLYHMDGGTLMLTHYCAVGNQPRMKAESVGPAEARFVFQDATGLASPEAGHMHRAVFRIEGPDRLRSAWTWREAGEDAFTERFTVRRVAGPAAAAGRQEN